MFTARFNPNDRSLIEGAVLTGQPADVAAALDAAIEGFRRRMKASGLPQIDGQPALMIYKPATAFDDIVIRAVVQEWSDQIGRAIALHWLPNPTGIYSPDVKFIS